MTTEERFWAKVNKTDGCWVWTGRKDGGGYGKLKIQNKECGAHRCSWEIHHGSIPDNLYVLHTCDNPLCVNIGHLFLGTHTDNMRDCIAKGRAKVGDNHWSRLYPERRARGEQHGSQTHPERIAKGERNGQTKLTFQQVQRIRILYQTGKHSKRKLGQQFKVDTKNIYDIVHFRTWKWL